MTVCFRQVAGTMDVDTVHVDNTKPFVSTKGQPIVLTTYDGAPAADLEPDEVEDGNERTEIDSDPGGAKGRQWVVEKVVGYRLVDGGLEFQLRWKGFGPADDTWTRESDMTCHDLVEDFFRTLGGF